MWVAAHSWQVPGKYRSTPPVKDFPMIRLVPILLLALSILPAQAQSPAGERHSGHLSKYAGEETRPIKSLSAADIDELRRGGGWGLAKAAELNGMPGPAHLLELKDEIPLDADQVARIEAIHAAMKAQAIATGETLIGLEAKLEDGFRDRTIDAAQLRAQLDAIAAARRDLRYMHLATHLQTPAILTGDQVARYNALRGYAAAADSCASVPAGHDAAQWKRHNGCS
jgi:hypothetical protein